MQYYLSKPYEIVKVIAIVFSSTDLVFSSNNKVIPKGKLT